MGIWVFDGEISRWRSRENNISGSCDFEAQEIARCQWNRYYSVPDFQLTDSPLFKKKLRILPNHQLFYEEASLCMGHHTQQLMSYIHLGDANTSFDFSKGIVSRETHHHIICLSFCGSIWTARCFEGSKLAFARRLLLLAPSLKILSVLPSKALQVVSLLLLDLHLLKIIFHYLSWVTDDTLQDYIKPSFDSECKINITKSCSCKSS